MKKFLPILSLLICWRLILFLWVILVENNFYIRPGFEFSLFSLQTLSHELLVPKGLSAWANFDGIHYLKLAQTSLFAEKRFLPFFPLLIKLFSGSLLFSKLSSLHFLIGLLISNVAYILSCLMLYKLVLEKYSSKRAIDTVLFLTLFPTSFFFVSLYSESIFLLLSLLAMTFLQKKRYAFFGLLVGILSITRLPGLLLIMVGVFEQLRYQEKDTYLRKLMSLSWILLAILPISILMYINFTLFSDPLAFVKAHGELNNSRSTTHLIFPIVTLYHYLQILIQLPISLHEWWIALLELSSVIFYLIGTFYVWRKNGWTMFTIFCISLGFLPLFSGTFSGFPRYLIIIFPIFIELSVLHPPKFKKILFFISFLIQLILLGLFTRGYFVA